MRRLLRVGGSAVAIGCAALAGCSDDAPSADRATAPSTGDGRVGQEITRGELRRTLRALQRIADEHDGNRAAGSGGGAATLDYVVERLRRAGWRVRREPVALPHVDERRSSRLSVDGDRLRRGRDFTTRASSGSGRVEGGATDVSERRRSANVIAETVAGNRGRRVVMAGAHLDSVPAGPGINDNGSGVAALLALADALGGRAPGAPVRLAFWTAEELGLIGSRRYVASLDRAQRRRIAAYVNLDMVGSPNATLYVNVGDRRVERVLRRLVGRGAVRTDPGNQTDSAPFRRAGIPVSGLFSGASRREDPCYHRACDDLESVNLATLQRLARVAAQGMERLSLDPPR